jgi:hypothetical protein
MIKKCMITAVILSFAAAGFSFAAAEEVLFGFEGGAEGWEIPDWAYEQPDYVQENMNISEEFASQGNSSLMVEAVFPGGRWAGAIVETMQYFDWSDYSALACDVYLPAGAPTGLKAKMILTVGDNWQWVEMSRSFDLVPGEWVKVEADISPGSIDWRRMEVTEAFRQDVRKIDIRVESNNKPAYAGPFYIDNVRLIK